VAAAQAADRAGAVPCVQVQFALDDPDRADAIVDHLLDAHLVACGQRTGPVVSDYRWHGARQRASEWLVLLKTRASLAGLVVDTVVGLHPYDTPEVVVLPITAGGDAYLRWVAAETIPLSE
jgi:periplasmic divalent cation tolerance protein